MIARLHVGGLVALGFDASDQYLLTVTHSGRGLFSTSTWKLMARDYDVVYPEAGICPGIGPLKDQEIKVDEIDYQTGTMRVVRADGLSLEYSEGVISVQM